jgi:large subunit ribosomal protein L21e
MTQSHGTRRKARSIMTKDNVLKGLSYLLTDYKVGDKVIVDIDSREHNSTPHRRFQGKIGVVREVGKRSLKITGMFGKKQNILQTRLNHTKLFIA